MKIKDLRYVYNDIDILIHLNQAIKNEVYFLDLEKTIKIILADGDERRYFRRAKNNITNFFLNENETDITEFGESAEHINEIRKIIFNKSFYDEQINETIYFYEAKEKIYFNEIQMTPDLVCYNKDRSVLCIIEIFYKHRKSEEDIEKLKKLNTVIYEISINNPRTTNILALPIATEKEIRSNAKAIYILKEQYRKIEKRIKNGNIRISRIGEDIKRVGRNNREIKNYTDSLRTGKPNEQKIYSEIKGEYRRENKNRVSEYKYAINQERNERKRINENIKRRESDNNEIKTRTRDGYIKIQKAKKEYTSIQKAYSKSNNELNQKIKRNKLQCENMEKKFNEAAKTKHVKTHVNSWMKTEHLNKNEKINLIKYYVK